MEKSHLLSLQIQASLLDLLQSPIDLEGENFSAMIRLREKQEEEHHQLKKPEQETFLSSISSSIG